jgi:AmmeMemoRadiSam system protein A
MDKENQNLLLKLARESIIENLSAKPSLTLEMLDKTKPKQLLTKEGAFVTLKKRVKEKDGTYPLRGCIGNVFGNEALYLTVYKLAKESAFGDPRFKSVTLKEMDEIRIEISVLSKPVAIKNHQQIVLGRDGVILTSGVQRSLFLPQVATEQGWTLSQLLQNLAMKAGLHPNAWDRSGCKLEVFQAKIFEEE